MNVFSIIGSFFRRARANAFPNPGRDWAVLLIFSTIALAGIVVWNIVVFDTVARGGVIGAPTLKRPPVFNRVHLDKVRTIFEARATEELKYRTGIYQYSDPSQ